MRIKLYITGLFMALLISQTSCSDDTQENSPGSGEGAIALSGITTRAGAADHPDLYLQAVVAEDSTVTYIEQTPITAPNGLQETTPELLNFTGGSPFYPIGDNEIRFFAYTGRATATGLMTLISGQQPVNDAILSNQGYRNSDMSTLTTEGIGTPGTSEDPAVILQFRHVMTRLEVIIEVDETEQPAYVDPAPESITFTMDGVYQTGTYPINALAPVANDETSATVATLPSSPAAYQVKEGINYLVPTGENLVGKTLNSLEIDDYTATNADLQNFQITYVDGNGDGILVPGYAYTLTFRINRLQVQAITLELVDWTPVEVENDEISYTPYELQLNLGDYDNIDADSIIKAVLWTSSGREYVGARLENGNIGFVTLPNETLDSVSLFTTLGLLLTEEPEGYTYNPALSLLDLPLSAGGMKLENPGLQPDENNPYLIRTPVQVFNMAKQLDGDYKQMNDIDVDRLHFSENQPLGPLATFTGSYDGNGFKVNNLIMTGAALILRNEGKIKNLHIASGRINATGQAVAGSICAVNVGTLVACVNEARIINMTGVAGGICGRNEMTGKIIGCVNTGSLETETTSAILGGICGENEDTDSSVFVACVNTGTLSRNANILGGIIGTTASTTSNPVIHTAYWLVGTAAKTIGGAEVAVGQGNVDIDGIVAAVSSERLRRQANFYSDVDETLGYLNDALATTPYGTVYKFTVDQLTTGSVWPIPVRI